MLDFTDVEQYCPTATAHGKPGVRADDGEGPALALQWTKAV